MSFIDLIGADRIFLGLRAADKAQVLREIARRAGAHLKLDAAPILQAIMAREAMGSTGLGRGFALPHVRIDAIAAPVGFLVRLAHPVEYEAIDGKPVDVVFLLLMPVAEDGGNIAALAAVSRSVRDAGVLEAIRKAGSAAGLVAGFAKPGAVPVGS